MKKEMSNTSGMESTPNFDISFIYCLKNMRIRSGRLNVRPINNRYFPNVIRYVMINFITKILLAFNLFFDC